MLTLKNHSLTFLLLIIVFQAIAIASASDLRITSVRIYFSNDRPDITVKRNYPLTAHAEMQYTGEGILRGHWEVDGEIFAIVTKTISSGQRVVIESPDSPKIPTFVSGTHKVSFVITSPPERLPFPRATYFVTSDEWEKKGGPQD